MDIVHQIKDYRTKHAETSDRINTTYMIGNRMTGYLAKRLILDYNFRGQQAELLQKHPELKETTMKLLGPVLFYDCDAIQTPLAESSSQFKSLMKIYRELEEAFEKELVHNEAKLHTILAKDN